MNREIIFAVTIILLVSIVCITVIACTAICAAQERWKIKNGVKPIILKSNEYLAEELVMNPDVSTAILFLGIVTVICITVIICTFIDRSHEKWCILHKTEPKCNNINTNTGEI